MEERKKERKKILWGMKKGIGSQRSTKNKCVKKTRCLLLGVLVYQEINLAFTVE